jgi:hypothetical protein
MFPSLAMRNFVELFPHIFPEKPMLDVSVLAVCAPLDVSVLQQYMLLWTCLSYSSMCSSGRVCPTAVCALLDVSVLHQPVMPQDVSVQQHPVLPLKVSLLHRHMMPVDMYVL